MWVFKQLPRSTPKSKVQAHVAQVLKTHIAHKSVCAWGWHEWSLRPRQGLLLGRFSGLAVGAGRETEASTMWTAALLCRPISWPGWSRKRAGQKVLLGCDDRGYYRLLGETTVLSWSGVSADEVMACRRRERGCEDGTSSDETFTSSLSPHVNTLSRKLRHHGGAAQGRDHAVVNNRFWFRANKQLPQDGDGGHRVVEDLQEDGRQHSWRAGDVSWQRAAPGWAVHVCSRHGGVQVIFNLLNLFFFS